MKTKLPRLYWDTSCFISYVNSKTEKVRHKVCGHILRKAQAGEVVICTSTFTIVEVIRPKHMPHPAPLSDEIVKALEGMFQWPFIKKYQVDETIALKAARLSRETNLKPIDAIHAATAIASGCDILQRWDRDFSKIAHHIKQEEPKYLTETPLLAGIPEEDDEE